MYEVYVYGNDYGVVKMFSKKEKTTAEKIKGEVREQSNRSLLEKVAFVIPGY